MKVQDQDLGSASAPSWWPSAGGKRALPPGSEAPAPTTGCTGGHVPAIALFRCCAWSRSRPQVAACRGPRTSMTASRGRNPARRAAPKGGGAAAHAPTSIFGPQDRTDFRGPPAGRRSAHSRRTSGLPRCPALSWHPSEELLWSASPEAEGVQDASVRGPRSSCSRTGREDEERGGGRLLPAALKGP